MPPPIGFSEPKPGDKCPGRFHSGRMLGLCSTQCSRKGGDDIAPAARVVMGFASCLNFHDASVYAVPSAAQAAVQGSPMGGDRCAGVQMDGAAS